MSLDVYLTITESQVLTEKIVIREHGQNREISLEEWESRYPGVHPVTVPSSEGDVYQDNITHNLNRMAVEAGLYHPLWRPEEMGIETADQLIAPLTTGLALLESDPERFRKFNPENGWGDYEGLVSFTRRYLDAATKYPTAAVHVSR